MAIIECAPPAVASRLGLLNGFELTIGGEPVTLQPAMQRLVAFVALHPRGVERDGAAFQLWPDTTEHHARANLRSTLWRLGKLDAEVVAVTARRLRMDDGVWLDIRDGLVDGIDPITGSGELLPDWYDEWLLVERERLRQVQLRLLDDHARAALAAGDTATAIQAGLAAVAMDPLRESGHRVVIEAHLAEGNPSEAKREYDRYANVLRHQLDLAPTPAMRALIDGLVMAIV